MSSTLQDLFGKLFREDHEFIFKIQGVELATFHYTTSTLGKGAPAGKLICFGVPVGNQPPNPAEFCIKIVIKAHSIYLSDYFYHFSASNFSRYKCPMKPAAGNMALHKKYLDTLLDFLAFALRLTTVELTDKSSKKFDACPPLPNYVFLVAGKKSFYESAAGFENAATSLKARQTGLIEIDDEDTLLYMKKLNIQASTFGELAQELIRLCKDAKPPFNEHAINYLVDEIEAKFKHAHGYKNEEEFDDAGDADDGDDEVGFEYEKTVTSTFDAEVTTSASMSGPFEPITANSKRYVMVDIYPIKASSSVSPKASSSVSPKAPSKSPAKLLTPKSRKPKNPARCWWGVTKRGFCKRKPKNPTKQVRAPKICKYGETRTNRCRRKPCKNGMDAAGKCKRRQVS